MTFTCNTKFISRMTFISRQSNSEYLYCYFMSRYPSIENYRKLRGILRLRERNKQCLTESAKYKLQITNKY